MIQIEEGRVVSFRYIMRNSREEILEDTMNGMPTAYLHGSLAIQPLLQEQLKGMKAGTRKKLYLFKSKDLAVDDDFTFEIIIDEVREASEEELMLGYPVQVKRVAMKIHLLSGFLGGGKTTAIQQAARILLQRDTRVGVITNDQGIKLVDADFFKSLNIPGRQVANGCFCCNYNALDDNIQSLIKTTNPEVIFAESVGSCTDIVATVAKPLLFYRKEVEVTVSVFADARLLYILLKGGRELFDEEVHYIYFKQLEEAGIIVINKVDCINSEDLNQLRLIVQERYGNKKLVFQNSLDAGSVQQWLDALDEQVAAKDLSSLKIDYDIYGEGEAKLAWLDQEIVICQPVHSAVRDAVDLVNEIHNRIRTENYFIGHLKFLLDGKTKISFTASSQEGDLVNFGNDEPGAACLLINARVQTEPSILSSIVAEAIKVVTERTGCRMVVNSMASFKPSFPRPTHRIF